METNITPVYLHSTGVGSLRATRARHVLHMYMRMCMCMWMASPTTLSVRAGQARARVMIHACARVPMDGAPCAQLDVLHWAAETLAARLGDEAIDDDGVVIVCALHR